MTEAVEHQHMLDNYRPSKEALEYAEKLKDAQQKLAMHNACLDAMMPSERQKEIYNSLMQQEPASYADNLAAAFRKGIIRGLEDYGDNRLVPPLDEIYSTARKVIDKEEQDFVVRERALFHREEIVNRMYNGNKKICFPAPVDIPFKFKEYAYIGGIFFLDDTKMTLEEGLRECMFHTIDDWLLDLPGVAMAMRSKRQLPPIEVVHMDGLCPPPEPYSFKKH